MNINNHLFIVFSKEHYNSLGVIRILGKNRIKPVFIAIKAKGPASRLSKYIETVHFVQSKEEGLSLLLEKYGNLEQKPFLITSDDETQQMLDENYSLINKYFYFFNAGKDGRITEFMDKENVLEMAKKHGIDVPKTVTVTNGDIPEGLTYPVITKSISPNVGGWKSDVHICNSEEDLREAYKNISSPKVLIQEFIDKDNELCVEGISINHGEAIYTPMAIKYNYLIQGYYSPYMTAYPFSDYVLIDKIQAVMQDIGFEGLFDVEFIIDKNGKCYFTEINFRNSIWNYIGVADDIPFPIIWADGILEGKFDEKLKKTISREYVAMVEPIDYGIRVKNGNTSLSTWLNDFKNADVLFYHDKDDLKPFEEMISNWEIYS